MYFLVNFYLQSHPPARGDGQCRPLRNRSSISRAVRWGPDMVGDVRLRINDTSVLAARRALLVALIFACQGSRPRERTSSSEDEEPRQTSNLLARPMQKSSQSESASLVAVR